MQWKKVKRSGNFRRKLSLRLEKILKESTPQIISKKSLTEQSSSTGEALVVVNTDFEGVTHYGDIGLEEENSSEIEAGPHLIELLDKNNNRRSKLRDWAITYGTSHIALKDLLHIWSRHLPKQLLPSDPRTLLNTPRDIILDNVGINSHYWHQGLGLCLKKCLANLKNITQTISMNINIDGLPIYRSSRKEFWPILFNIYELPHIKPMVIGIYYGCGKPSDIKTFLQPFVTETISLLENGLLLNNRGRESIIHIKITPLLFCWFIFAL